MDIVEGKYAGKVLVNSLADPGGSGRHATYNCTCECGKRMIVRSTVLRTVLKNKSEYSCGSCFYYIVGDRQLAKLRYNVWRNMIERCYNVTEESDPDHYERYRKRGIRVCKKWYRSSVEFARWAMSNGYSKGKQLDRKDNDASYKPSNCRLVMSKVNVRNRERTLRVLVKGKSVVFAELVERRSVVSYGLAFQRHFSMGWSLRKALLTPARKGNYR